MKRTKVFDERQNINPRDDEKKWSWKHISHLPALIPLAKQSSTEYHLPEELNASQSMSTSMLQREDVGLLHHLAPKYYGVAMSSESSGAIPQPQDVYAKPGRIENNMTDSKIDVNDEVDPIDDASLKP